MPPKTLTLPDGKTIEYDYERALDNALTRRTAATDTTTFAYDFRHSQLTEVVGGLGRQTMAYTPSGKTETDTWEVDGENHVSRWQHSMSGVLQSLTDSNGTVHTRDYDTLGRLQQVVADTVTISFGYDDFSRVSLIATTDIASGHQLSQTLSYDDFDREIGRVLEVVQDGTSRQLTQTLSYTARDQVASRTWAEGSGVATETYRYDSRGRLIEYTANEAAAAVDPFGNRIVRQLFTLNALDGNEVVVSEFADGSQDTATFSYNPDDPTQVVQIDHTHSSWPASLTVKYDPCGRVIEDGMGRTLSWDAQDRLVKVSKDSASCGYRYSPTGKLVDRELDGTLTRSFFSGDLLTHERTGEELLSYIGDGTTVFAQNGLSAAIHTVTLLGCDAQGTVRVEADSDIRTPRYTPHGAGHTDDLQSPLGFAGERVDEMTGWYIPGGYRPYDPILMCFLSPDSESPFGRGGLNPYAYCGGDPVNNIDPDGHEWWTWLLAGIGTVLGVVATVGSLGAAAPAVAAFMAGGFSALTLSGAGAIAAAGLGMISLATGTASMALEIEGKDEKAAEILGWISLGTGLAGSLVEIAPKATKAVSSARALIKHAPTRGRYLDRILHVSDQGTADFFYIENYKHKNFNGLAIFTHGNKNGELMAKTGKVKSATRVAKTDFADIIE